MSLQKEGFRSVNVSAEREFMTNLCQKDIGLLIYICSYHLHDVCSSSKHLTTDIHVVANSHQLYHVCSWSKHLTTDIHVVVVISMSVAVPDI